LARISTFKYHHKTHTINTTIKATEDYDSLENFI